MNLSGIKAYGHIIQVDSKIFHGIYNDNYPYILFGVKTYKLIIKDTEENEKGESKNIMLEELIDDDSINSSGFVSSDYASLIAGAYNYKIFSHNNKDDYILDDTIKTNCFGNIILKDKFFICANKNENSVEIYKLSRMPDNHESSIESHHRTEALEEQADSKDTQKHNKLDNGGINKKMSVDQHDDSHDFLNKMEDDDNNNNEILMNFDDIYASPGQRIKLKPFNRVTTSINGISCDVVSSSPEIVVPDIVDGVLQLNISEDSWEDDVVITMIANDDNGVVDEKSFTVHVRVSLMTIQDPETGIYSILDDPEYEFETNAFKINSKMYDDSFMYEYSKENIRTSVSVLLPGTKVEIDQTYYSTISLPQSDDFKIMIDSDGKVTMTIPHVLFSKDPLPLGSSVEVDRNVIRCIVPMPEILEF